MIEKKNREYEKYNKNKTKEVKLELKLEVDENLSEREVHELVSSMADDMVCCDSVKSLNISHFKFFLP